MSEYLQKVKVYVSQDDGESGPTEEEITKIVEMALSNTPSFISVIMKSKRSDVSEISGHLVGLQGVITVALRGNFDVLVLIDTNESASEEFKNFWNRFGDLIRMVNATKFWKIIKERRDLSEETPDGVAGERKRI